MNSSEGTAVDLSAYADACRSRADVVARRTHGVVAVLLAVRDSLRCYAASGAWRMYYGVPMTEGPAGESFINARTVIAYAAQPGGLPYPLDSSSVATMCVPIKDGWTRPWGVIKVDWPSRPVEHWRPVVESAAAELARQLERLGQSPRETLAERLVRQSLAIASVNEDARLVPQLLRAARDVSGLSTAVGLLIETDGTGTVRTEPDAETVLAQRIRALSSKQLREICESTHRYGVWYTCGEPTGDPGLGSRPLIEAGARSVIAIPVIDPRIAGMPHDVPGQRSLLVLDEQVRNPSITTVAQLELLAAQAIVSHARLRLLDSLRLQASRDPLTGLGHQASLAQRMSKPTTGMAAVLLIDIDDFKQINDTLGHAAGDHVLLRLVESMRKTLRPDDELFRIGGDEFVAVLGVGAHAEVSGIARRLCTAAHGTGCTVSIGTALIGRGEAIDDALSRADAAMYDAKHAGGDHARVAG